eukprot:jgi/Botrbrau1/9341/Bobra.0086s0025.1
MLTSTVRKRGCWGSTACNLSEAAIFNKEDGSCLAKSPGFPEASADEIRDLVHLLANSPQNEDSFTLGDACYYNILLKDRYLMAQGGKSSAPEIMVFAA